MNKGRRAAEKKTERDVGVDMMMILMNRDGRSPTRRGARENVVLVIHTTMPVMV